MTDVGSAKLKTSNANSTRVLRPSLNVGQEGLGKAQLNHSNILTTLLA